MINFIIDNEKSVNDFRCGLKQLEFLHMWYDLVNISLISWCWLNGVEGWMVFEGKRASCDGFSLNIVEGRRASPAPVEGLTIFISNTCIVAREQEVNHECWRYKAAECELRWLWELLFMCWSVRWGDGKGKMKLLCL